MPARRESGASWQARPGLIYSTRLHVVLYSMLLVATPFIMLRVFLQEAIGKLSISSFSVGEVTIHVIPAAALILLVSLLVVFRSRFTRRRALAGVCALLLVALAQEITDYYFDHNFFDLQQNWHYFAYTIFAFMMYRDLKPRGHAAARIMLITYLAAVVFSTFDETFQKHMSHRVFDISDIAKDAWGVLIGLVLLHLGENRPGSLRPAAPPGPASPSGTG